MRFLYVAVLLAVFLVSSLNDIKAAGSSNDLFVRVTRELVTCIDLPNGTSSETHERISSLIRYAQASRNTAWVLGPLYTCGNQLDESVRVLPTLLNKTNRPTLLTWFLADTHAKLEHAEIAADYWQRLGALPVLRLWAERALACRNWKSAEAFARASIHVRQQDLAGAYFLALALKAQGNREAAMDALRVAITNGKLADPGWLAKIEAVQEQLSDWQGALNTSRLILEIVPLDGDAFVRVGRVLIWV